MAISLTKGGNISLEQETPGLTKIEVGLGWDERATAGAAFDLDASAFLCNESGKTRSDADFIFYGQLQTPDGSVQHTGDDPDGSSSEEGDDESIIVALDQLGPDVAKIAFTVTIHEAGERGQNFGMVSNAYIRIVNAADKKEVCRYDLTEDFSIETALIFGELYRHSGAWKFRAVGQGFQGGLKELCNHHGVQVA